MSPSSLIFVAVAVTWIVYLVVHVARRREQLATARNVDRFSSQMRVLQRRAVANSTVETPGRVRSTSLGVSQPLVAGARPAVEGHTLIHARPSSEQLTAPATAGVARSRALARQKQRAVVLLVSLAVTLISGIAVVFGPVPWVVPVLSALVAVGMIVRMRSAVLADKAERKRAAAARRRERLDAERARREAVYEARPAAHAMPVAQEHYAPHEAPFDMREVEARLEAEQAAKAAKATDPLFDDDGWEPAPVPPPTYTMKAKAYRPLPPPAEVTPAVEPVEEEQQDWNEGSGGARVVGA